MFLQIAVVDSVTQYINAFGIFGQKLNVAAVCCKMSSIETKFERFSLKVTQCVIVLLKVADKDCM